MKMLVIILIILISCNEGIETASPVTVNEDSISTGTLELADSLSASIHELDSLKPLVRQTIAKLKEYEQLKEGYQAQETEILYKPIVDSSAIIALRSKLTAANNEISRLNGELSAMAYKRNVTPIKETYIQPAIITPDENSLTITLDGSSRRGNITIPENLTIYLIPYSKKLEKSIGYDSSCSGLNGELSKYYNGLYFFNSVEPGKYILKVCTYMGNVKVINKRLGKHNINMQISPPIQ